jgi:hypothetical protein
MFSNIFTQKQLNYFMFLTYFVFYLKNEFIY